MSDPGFGSPIPQLYNLFDKAKTALQIQGLIKFGS